METESGGGLRSGFEAIECVFVRPDPTWNEWIWDCLRILPTTPLCLSQLGHPLSVANICGAAADGGSVGGRVFPEAPLELHEPLENFSTIIGHIQHLMGQMEPHVAHEGLFPRAGQNRVREVPRML